MQEITLDSFDFKILHALHKDGRLTNQQLADTINLSPSQCSRRRVALEESGVIKSYSARISREKIDVNLLAFISITLAKHSGDNADKFKRLIQSRSEIEEAFALTGTYDYLLKVAVKDLKALSYFINEGLLRHEAITNVHSSIVLQSLKEA